MMRRGPPEERSAMGPFSELESALARPVGDGAHAAVVEEAVAVEHDLLDSLLAAAPCPSCRRLPARRCAGRCGRRRAGAAPRCRAPACAPAPGGVPARRRWDWFASARPRGARRLAGLAADALLGVLDALRLVGLRRPELAQCGRGLAEQLAVGALERDHHLAV